MTKVEADTLYGTLSLLVLQTIAAGPLHGLEISRRIHEQAGEALKIDEGALYPALHRLERDGLVEGEWGVSEKRRRAKFYRLTERGAQRLRHDVQRWVRHANAVASVLGVPAAWGD
jgi:transcriptional regulator